MCGIAGVIGRGDAEAVRRMVQTLPHRGPDDHGVWHSHDAALGHTRLAILDLSAAAHQPMSDASGRLHVVFNGEIYNYRSLRAQLQEQGRVFRTQSDTEVLLHAYAAWGPDFITRLEGMFALALVDTAPPPGQPQVLLARDRLGIKPLLFGQHDGALWFASEARALRAVGLGTHVDAEAVLDYMAVGSVYQPRTFFADIEALPPGTCMHIHNGKHHVLPYWDLHTHTEALRRDLRNIDMPGAQAMLRAALHEATRLHLLADVPVGAFLSGGIDSTAVVGLMGQATGSAVQTFAVGFEDRFASMDERPFARRAAAAVGAQHHEITVTTAEAPALFEGVVRACDQPSLDGTNTFVVSRAARAHVTVALSGLGSDELLAGYDHFRWLRALHRHPGGRHGALGQIGEALMRLRPNAPLWRALLQNAAPATRLAMLRRLVGDHAMRHTVHPQWIGRFRSRLRARHAPWLRGDDAVQQVSYAEVRGYLLSTLLRDCDVMSMAHGLEVRPVLLHHPLVELMYALPGALKLRGRQGKAVLVQALHDVLPREVQQRRKRGFEMPFSGWLAGPLQHRVRDLWHTPAAHALFTRSYRERTEQALMGGKPPRALWAWAVLLAWLQQERLEV